MNTRYGVWLRRPTRKDQRENSWRWGWATHDTNTAAGHHRFVHTAEYMDRAGFDTYREAESFAVLLASRYPEMIGWLEIRLFAGYLDSRGVFVTPGR